MMLFVAPMGEAAPPPAAPAAQHCAYTNRVFSAPDSDGPSLETDVVGDLGDSFEVTPIPTPTTDEFDWGNPKITKEFIRLEQKVLARKATEAEIDDYHRMKRDRNTLLAERQLRDYAEVQRLRMLAQKLAEVEKYLRPLVPK